MSMYLLKWILASSFFITSILFVSCSSIPKSDFQNAYYSPEYEAESFENVSMDICFPKNIFDSYTTLDSSTVSFQINFDTTFRSYFPDGIKLFSSVTETGWIFYETKLESDPILYDKISGDRQYLYSVSMPDSLSFFQSKSKSDFLFVTHYITFIGNSPTQQNISSNTREKFNSIVTMQYSIWNTNNSDLIVTDQITTSMEFNKPADKWPLRGVILKLAYEIFQRLPMFEK